MHLIQSGGLALIALVVFADTGLFLGFILPGDTLLIAAGVYAKEGKLSFAGLLVVAALAAIAGDSCAYFIGRKLGPVVFQKEDSLLFRPDHVARAQKFFDRYGAKTLLIAHFVPVIRTFTPLLAGVGDMPYRKFLTFNAIGDILWGVIIGLLGYYVGSRIPNIDHYILIALAAVIILALAPTLYHIGRLQLKKRRKDQASNDKQK